MAVYEALLLNTVVPQIQAAQAGDSYVMVVNATTPALRITQTGTGNALEVEDSANPDATPFVVSAAGDVGIGTSSPLSKFHINVDGIAQRITRGSALGYLYWNGSTSSSDFTLQAANGNVQLFCELGSSGVIKFATEGAERARITSTGTLNIVGAGTAGSTQAISFNGSTPVDTLVTTSGGDVGIGTSSPLAKLHVAGEAIFVSGATTQPAITITQGFINGDISSANFTIGNFGDNSSEMRVATRGFTTFFTGATNNNTGTERARITSGGYFKASNTGTYLGSTATYHEINQTANDNILFIRSTDANYSVDGVQLRFNRNTTTNIFYALSYYNDAAAAYKFRVADSGDVTNTNGTYGTITSERRFKQDIVDAASQWDDIKNVRVRKFRMIKDVEQFGNKAQTQIGVIVDELEQVSPGLVFEAPEYEYQKVPMLDDRGNPMLDDDGNPIMKEEKVQIGVSKGWKNSVLYMKAIKALQEAMARIETLEAKIAVLEAK